MACVSRRRCSNDERSSAGRALWLALEGAGDVAGASEAGGEAGDFGELFGVDSCDAAVVVGARAALTASLEGGGAVWLTEVDADVAVAGAASVRGAGAVEAAGGGSWVTDGAPTGAGAGIGCGR